MEYNMREAAEAVYAAVEELLELRAEVERLREERAATVSWLRQWQNTLDDRITHEDVDFAVGIIERGEHIREEEP